MELLRRMRESPRARRLLLAYAAGSAGLTLSAGGWLLLPLPTEVAEAPPVTGVELVDRNGMPLRSTRASGGARGGWVSLDDVDPELLQAFLAVEDRRFYHHHGVDLLSVARAVRDNLASGGVVSGASTITMQTARILRPTPRTWPGKIRQALWAMRIESHRDKDWILEQYINRVPLGQATVGVAAAAELYFSANPERLSLAQAALLAGLARSPARDNPITSATRAASRRAVVLGEMLDVGYAGAEDVALALAEPPVGHREEPPFRAPHFTSWALARAKDADSGADRVRTTLDLDLQEALEAEVRHAVDVLGERNVRHAAAVVLENGTGGILAWVGSPDFWADSTGQVDMVVSRRQPGSTLKPFLYGLAFQQGYTPATVLPDVPRAYATPTGPYEPDNYDRRFRGPVRARVALASSLNVPAVELASRIGPGALLGVLRSAGFESLDRDATHYGLGLALGNGEVTLLELANAYRGLAAGGVWRPVRWSAADVAPPEGTRFLQAGTAALLLDILSDPVARMQGFGSNSPLDFPFPAAAKTGTSRNFTDNWAVATTADFTVAVWVGNFSGSPMEASSGITGAGPLLNRAVYETARRYPAGDFGDPGVVGGERVAVCVLSGMRAANGCASVVEWFLPGTVPQRADDWEVGGHVTLPAEYAEWAAGVSNKVRPGEPDDVGALRIAAGEPDVGDGAGADSGFVILSPTQGDVFEVPPGVDARYATVPLVAAGGEGVRWMVDGRPLAASRWVITPGVHSIVAQWPSGIRDSVEVRVVTP